MRSVFQHVLETQAPGESPIGDPPDRLPAEHSARVRSTSLVLKFARGRFPRGPVFLISALLVLLGLSFLDQLALTARDGELQISTFLYLPALGLIAGALLAFGPREPIRFATWLTGVAQARLPRISYVVMALAVVCALYSAAVVHSNGSPTNATVAWVLGIVLASAAVVVPEAAAVIRRMRPREWRGECWPLVALLIILGGAAALRMISLDTVPGFIHGDEGEVGLSARAVATGQVNSIFSYGFVGLPMLGYAWDALFLKLFGDSLWSLRASSSVLGLGSIAITALLGKELFNWRSGLLAAALLSLFHPHIQFSRDGIHNIQALFMLTLTVYLLVLALRYGSRSAAIGTGVALSVDLQVFFSARLSFAVVPLVVLGVLLGTNRALLLPRLPTLGWLVVGFLVAGAPVIAFIELQWTTFISHSSGALITSTDSSSRVHLFGAYGTYDIWPIMRVNIWRALQTFNFPGHTSMDQYPMVGHQMLDPVSGSLLAGSLALALFRIRHTGFAICAIMFVVIMFFVGTLTMDQPDWNRLLIILPVLALLLGAFLDALWQLIERIRLLKKPAVIAGLGLLAAVGYGNFTWYFVQFQPWIRQTLDALPMDVGNYLRHSPDRPYAFVIDGAGFSIEHEAVRFLAPSVPRCLVPRNLDFSQCAPAPANIRLFFLLPSQVTLLPRLRAIFPGGTLSTFHSYKDNEKVMLYRVKYSPKEGTR